MKHFENFYIRILWIIRASSLKFKVGCPPACSEGHTYRWPCKARISHLPGAKKQPQYKGYYGRDVH